MKVTVIGTGYVGLVTGTCFAESGNDVICVDIDTQKIAGLQQGKIPIYEPGLEELVKRNQAEGRLRFSDNAAWAITEADIVFSAVPTPPDKDSRADLQYVKQVAQTFGRHIKKFTVFVNKSTVPVGTADICMKIIAEEIQKRQEVIPFEVVSNPEFLREGSAITDTMRPDRIVVGIEGKRARKILEKLYMPFLSHGAPLVFTDCKSAEVIKYAANSFLATKISFINEIACFCEKSGADVAKVAEGMGLDARIGKQFLRAGIGYGGSCFPKDIKALLKTGKEYGYDFRILEAVEVVNRKQKKLLFTRLQEVLPNLEGKVIAVLGLAFKPNTDDMRDAPSIPIVKKLQAEGAIVQVFDPVAMEKAKQCFSKVNLSYAANPYEAVAGADAVLMVTEWEEFYGLNLQKLRQLMSGNIVIDGRNIFSLPEMQRFGFQYISVGRPQGTMQLEGEYNDIIFQAQQKKQLQKLPFLSYSKGRL